jgi:hypothetical protein
MLFEIYHFEPLSGLMHTFCLSFLQAPLLLPVYLLNHIKPYIFDDNTVTMVLEMVRTIVVDGF